MKSSKFSSLEELKEETEARTGKSLPNNPQERFKKYGHKRKVQYNASCVKHGALHLQCAQLGSQRTRFKRWQRNSDRVFCRSNSIVSDSEMVSLERRYNDAKERFHKEPCTCPSN